LLSSLSGESQVSTDRSAPRGREAPPKTPSLQDSRATTLTDAYQRISSAKHGLAPLAQFLLKPGIQRIAVHSLVT
jgi:hypothetical protein